MVIVVDAAYLKRPPVEIPMDYSEMQTVTGNSGDYGRKCDDIIA